MVRRAVLRRPKINQKERLLAAIEPGADLARIEQAIEKVCGISGAEALQAEIQQQADAADAIAVEQPPICPRCQRPMIKHGRRKRTLQSTLGDVAFTRQLYRCGQCAEPGTVAPADAALGIKAGQRLTPFAEEVGEQFGRDAQSYLKGRELMAVTLEIGSADTLRQIVQRHHRELQTTQQPHIAAVRRAPRQAPLQPFAATASDTLILEVDGVMIPGRPPTPTAPREPKASEECPAPADESRAGGSRPKTRHREVKLGVVYRQRDRIEKPPSKNQPDRPGRGMVLRSQMAAHIGHWEDFAEKFYTLAVTMGALVASRVVLIGDGAKWIDDLANEFFGEAIRILDFWHAMEYVAKPARLAFGPDSAAFRAWLSEQRRKLRAGELDAVLLAIRGLGAGRRINGLSAAIDESLSYLQPRRAQMDYPRFEAMGLPIASGLIEGRNKTIVKARCDNGGQRWHPHGAIAVIDLRIHAHNQRNRQAA